MRRSPDVNFQNPDPAAIRPLLQERPRIVFFGMRCAFSVPPLRALISAGFDIRAIALPGALFGPPITHQSTVQTLKLTPADVLTDELDEVAAKVRAPVFTIGDVNHPGVAEAIARLEPDLVAVACFPARIPPALLEIPRLGWLNVHPSLLPRGRGPEPLFWTFRRGESTTGVTVHLMEERFDAGPVLKQSMIDVPSGIRLPELERQLAKLGGDLLVEAINEVTAGTATPVKQDEALVTYAPTPSPSDYTVATDLPARRAFNFVRGVAPATDRFTVVVMATKEQIFVVDALSYSETETSNKPVTLHENRVVIAFQSGSVTFGLPQSG